MIYQQNHVKMKKRKRPTFQQKLEIVQRDISSGIRKDMKKSVEPPTASGCSFDEATSEEMPLQSHVGVIVRGEITRRMFDIWAARIFDINNDVVISNTYSRHVGCIVVHSSCTPNEVLSWARQTECNMKSITVPILKKEWIIESLKNKRLLDHDLPRFGLWDNAPTINLPAVIDARSEVEPTQLTRESSLSLVDAKHAPDGPKPIPVSWLERNKDKFACAMSGTASAASRPQNNKHITDVFEKLQDMYELTGDDFRATVYKRCCATLALLPHVTDASQLKGVHGIGKSLIEKVDEILETGSLKKLEGFNSNPKIQALIALSGVWGIGEKTAEALVVKHGIMSIEDLKVKGKHLLNAQQLIGLSRYEELKIRIPRSEVQQIESIVSEHANRLLPGIQCTVCGSYRRGKQSSGDVDILLGPPEGVEHMDVLADLLVSLTEAGFLTDHLAGPFRAQKRPSPKPEPSAASAVRTASGLDDSFDHDTEATKAIQPIFEGNADSDNRASYMGICLVPGDNKLHRRIDIKSYSRSTHAFALLYFTGSDHFNRSMRFFASKKGYTLTDKHIALCVRDSKREHVAVGNPVPCSSEREIFEVLQLPYKEPWERNCFDLSNK